MTIIPKIIRPTFKIVLNNISKCLTLMIFTSTPVHVRISSAKGTGSGTNASTTAINNLAPKELVKLR